VLSADGRFVVFQSDASNLVRGDTNRTNDVFVRDRRAGTTELVSISSAGVQGNDTSAEPTISADGRFIAFSSRATNLVPGAADGARLSREPPGNRNNVFIRDRLKGTTRRISVSPAGAPGNDNSATPAISADGRFVAFLSDASNLVPGDTNGVKDVFVRDRRTGTTRRVSVSSAGAQSKDSSDHPALSADGRLVAFQSGASNLVPGDTNGTSDVFIRIPAPGRAH
jgi:Tol biopolymer transport system component